MRQEFRDWISTAIIFDEAALKNNDLSKVLYLTNADINAILRDLDMLMIVPKTPQSDIVVAAGACKGVSVSGVGLDHLSALTSVAGEAAEALALTGGRSAGPEASRAASLLSRIEDGSCSTWSQAEGLDGAPVGVPRDLLQLRAQVKTPVSEGCAAWRDYDGAKAGAILELVERDAAALWWYGARPGRLLHFDLNAVPWRRAPTTVDRTVHLVDISPHDEWPVVMAVSFDAGGLGFASGAGAGLDFDEAAWSALRELAQMEFGQALLHMQIAIDGLASVLPRAQAELDRAKLIRQDAFLAEAIDGGSSRKVAPRPSRAKTVAQLADRLDQTGVQVWLAELGRIGPLFVAKALSADLQSSNPDAASPRLHKPFVPFPFTKGLRLY